jgi:hypothetical protein
VPSAHPKQPKYRTLRTEIEELFFFHPFFFKKGMLSALFLLASGRGRLTQLEYDGVSEWDGCPEWRHSGIPGMRSLVCVIDCTVSRSTCANVASEIPVPLL